MFIAEAVPAMTTNVPQKKDKDFAGFSRYMSMPIDMDFLSVTSLSWSVFTGIVTKVQEHQALTGGYAELADFITRQRSFLSTFEKLFSQVADRDVLAAESDRALEPEELKIIENFLVQYRNCLLELDKLISPLKPSSEDTSPELRAKKFAQQLKLLLQGACSSNFGSLVYQTQKAWGYIAEGMAYRQRLEKILEDKPICPFPSTLQSASKQTFFGWEAAQAYKLDFAIPVSEQELPFQDFKPHRNLVFNSRNTFPQHDLLEIYKERGRVEADNDIGLDQQSLQEARMQYSASASPSSISCLTELAAQGKIGSLARSVYNIR